MIDVFHSRSNAFRQPDGEACIGKIGVEIFGGNIIVERVPRIHDAGGAYTGIVIHKGVEHFMHNGIFEIGALFFACSKNVVSALILFRELACIHTHKLPEDRGFLIPMRGRDIRECSGRRILMDQDAVLISVLEIDI